MKYAPARRFVDVSAFEEVVNLIVCETICIFFRPKEDEGLQVGGRDLVNKIRRSAHMRCQGANSALVQPGKRKHVCGTVAELSDEAHQGRQARAILLQSDLINLPSHLPRFHRRFRHRHQKE